MASKKLMDLLNKAIARELQVSIQYMWQHIMLVGAVSRTVGTELRAIAIAEMMHAETIAERLFVLGGKPTTDPDKITVGKDCAEMLRLDVKAEEEAIEMYREIIDVADKEKDITTRMLFEGIFAEEEQHLITFQQLQKD